MARRGRSSIFETPDARRKLSVRKKPYHAAKLARGINLDYRRNKAAGTWVVKVADGSGGNWTAAIGTADDIAKADGNDVFDFWQAQDRARARARLGSDGTDDDGKPATITRALERYAADLKLRGGDPGNVGRVRAHLPQTLAARSCALVTARELRLWRDRLVEKLAPATVNRTRNALVAALNLAAEHDERIAANRRARETGLASIPDAHQSRNVILEEAAIRAIIAKASEQSLEFGLLVETAAITGARVSQLARIEVQDLQDHRSDPRLMMPSSKKGAGQKKISHRPVPITPDLAAKLRTAASGREPTAPLLTKSSGQIWGKADHWRLFGRTARAAGLDPTEVTIYALRHSSIVRQLLANVPVLVVAVNHDTSVVMIERTYSRHIGDHADALARKALLDLGAPAADNVVPLGAAR
jgi:integrase